MKVRSLAVGFGVATTVVCLLCPAPALADVAPPPDYVEQCARWKVEADDEYCELRSAGFQDPFGCLEGQTTEPADVEACQSAQAYDFADCCQEWIDAGWTYECDTWGGSVWQSMWCRAREDGDPARPPSPEGATEEGDDGDGGCAIDRRTARGSAGALCALVLLGLVAISRRFRRPS